MAVATCALAIAMQPRANSPALDPTSWTSPPSCALITSVRSLTPPPRCAAVRQQVLRARQQPMRWDLLPWQSPPDLRRRPRGSTLSPLGGCRGEARDLYMNLASSGSVTVLASPIGVICRIRLQLLM